MNPKSELDLDFVRAATAALRKGWDRQEVFQKAEDHCSFDILGHFKPGWFALVFNLSRQLGIEIERRDFANARRVITIINEAELFLHHLKPAEVEISSETVERSIQRATELLERLFSNDPKFHARAVVDMLQKEFSFVPKEV